MQNKLNTGNPEASATNKASEKLTQHTPIVMGH